MLSSISTLGRRAGSIERSVEVEAFEEMSDASDQQIGLHKEPSGVQISQEIWWYFLVSTAPLREIPARLTPVLSEIDWRLFGLVPDQSRSVDNHHTTTFLTSRRNYGDQHFSLDFAWVATISIW